MIELRLQRAKRAILHLDADAFFASCEQALNPKYMGKPVVTGKERNIVSAASYEAKALGIKRGVPLWEAKKKFPELIVLPSNYETYSIFSERMFAIMRRFTSEVEAYSIDEAFAEITGLRRPLHKSYPQIALAIKQEIEKELGITVSVGLSYSKVLAKLASKLEKPSGFTVIHQDNLEKILENTSLEEVWGIGAQTNYFLQKYQITNAWEFAQQEERWIDRKLTKPHKEIWHELNGRAVLNLELKQKSEYQGISKTKTFTPASKDPVYLFAQLSKNIENALIKCRRHNLAAQRMNLYLKTKDFHYQGLEIRFNRATAYPQEVLPLAEQVFKKLFHKNSLYRATGVWLHHLQPRDTVQLNLFESPLQLEKYERIFKGLDKLASKFGKHTVFLGSSFWVHQQPDQRQKNRAHHLRGSRQFIKLPFLGEAK